MSEPEIVEGMAEAIERRRLERGLSPTAFAEAAGVTQEGLRPLRKGHRRRYQDSVKLGAAKALGWRADAIDRLLMGEQPIELDDRNATPAIEELRREIDELRGVVTELVERLGSPTGPNHGTR